jgi:hypothetical protein
MHLILLYSLLVCAAQALTFQPNQDYYIFSGVAAPATVDKFFGFTASVYNPSNVVVSGDLLEVTAIPPGCSAGAPTNTIYLTCAAPLNSADITNALHSVKFRTSSLSSEQRIARYDLLTSRGVYNSANQHSYTMAFVSQTCGTYYPDSCNAWGWDRAEESCPEGSYIATLTSSAEYYWAVKSQVAPYYQTMAAGQWFMSFFGAVAAPINPEYVYPTGTPEAGGVFGTSYGNWLYGTYWGTDTGLAMCYGGCYTPDETNPVIYGVPRPNDWYGWYGAVLCEYSGPAIPYATSGEVTLNFEEAIPLPFECHTVNFWVMEGILGTFELQAPPAISLDFHNTLYADLQTNQQPAATGCPNPATFDLKAGTQVPPHHTPTPPGYTPAISPFALSSSGGFKYVNLPTSANPTVWNGYDSFEFTATCTANSQTQTCDGRAAINVVYTTATQQNMPRPAFSNDYDMNYLQCSGNCRDKTRDGMWLARHTLPRLWDMQRSETGAPVLPSITWNGETKDTDGLDFEWSSNFALITAYGAIGNMAVRFPTFEIIQPVPGSPFDESAVTSQAAGLSTGFEQLCLQYQGNTGHGSDVWVFNADQADGSLGPLYKSSQSWYQKFGGKHEDCDVFTGTDMVAGNAVRKQCLYAPLLSPRASQSEDAGGVWKLAVKDCTTRWQGKFTWNAMRNQKLKNGNDALYISGGGSNAFTITGEIYNQAVQPNSWTDPSRGFVEIDHKYLLTVTLSQDTNFQFELGVDIFTVDLQQFRYFVGNEHAFGFNMIIYPKKLNDITPQSQPDRRVTGFQWVEHKWIAPGDAECAGMACGGTTKPGRFSSVDSNGNYVADMGQTACVNSASTPSDYVGNDFPSGNCGTGDSPAVFLYKGPSTPSGDSVCTNADPMNAFRDVMGISPQYPSYPSSPVVCSIDYQNITLRGRSPGSNRNQGNGAFGFEGKITLTFQLKNGEHPHFVITPQMYVKSISIDGAFAGSSSTCRGSPYWPVGDTTSLPQYLCEEVDARTFGPTDWASIFFDIKDVDESLVEMTKLTIVVNSITVKFFPLNDASVGGTDWTPQYAYLNFRDLKTVQQGGVSTLDTPSAPSGVAPPKKTDYAFAFTPGAHNENAKITIYCTLRIKSSAVLRHSTRRFASSGANVDAENSVQERISINKGFNPQLSSSSSNQRIVEGSNNQVANSNAGGGVTVVVLASACAVLMATVIGIVLYVVRSQYVFNAPKRVSSTA